jgi:xylulokinase
LLGLNSGHTRGDLYRAVLEGCAYEMEYQRQQAGRVTGEPAGRIVAAGGGTRNRAWMQIKADVFGCPLDVLELEETSLLGAAMLAGIGSAVCQGVEAARNSLTGVGIHRYTPHPQRGAAYRDLFTHGYAEYEGLVRSVHLPPR